MHISYYTSKALSVFQGMEFDMVVTPCGSAREECPYLSGGKKLIHRGFFPIPPRAQGNQQKLLEQPRGSRDSIKGLVQELMEPYFKQVE
ncbi:MAG: hypothetical protein DRI93_06775 [Aquificota bacterium]|nr:MAG: hypothetical protein DRI93_06775 [Aquificota bacterium]